MEEFKLCQGDELKKFLEAQCAEIQKHKWIESERVGHDLGCNAIQEWIKKYAKLFRDEYKNKH